MPIKTTVGEFLAAFFPDPDEPLCLRTFGPRGAPPEAVEYKPVKLRVTRATLVKYKDELKRLNRTRGVYFVVNAGGNTDEEIHRFSSGFCEDDTLPIEEQHKRLDLAAISPSIRVVTKKSVHAYWLLEPGCAETEWRQVQAGLVAHFGGDPKIKNASRVMRVPYFNHVSINGDGRLLYKRVELVEFDPAKRYSVAELLKAFPSPVLEAAVKSSELEGPASYGTWDELNAEARQRIASHPTARKRPDGWIHCRGICHNGKSDSAIALSPATGAYHCQAGCDTREIRKAFGLPEEPQARGTVLTGPRVTGLYRSLPELMAASLPDREEILTGIRRGEVTQLASVTNVGKSTLLLNAIVALLSETLFPPLVTEKHKPVKVLYVDCESPAGVFRHDIAVMKQGRSGAIDANLLTWVDGEIEGEPISFSRPEHLGILAGIVQKHDVGLVVIDTVSSAFDIRKENENGDVTRWVMKPLIGLARSCNCAAVFAHHHGKPSESGGVKAYHGRGASAFGALSRTVLTLRNDETRGEGYAVLELAKSKGSQFATTLLKLNRETRWFEQCGETPTPNREEVSVTEIVAWVTQKGGEAKTGEILKAFKSRASERTIYERLAEALKQGLLTQEKQGSYQTPDFLQSCNSYTDCRSAETEQSDTEDFRL